MNALIRDPEKKFKRTGLQLGRGRFENYSGTFVYDFRKEADPSVKGFFQELISFLT